MKISDVTNSGKRTVTFPVDVGDTVFCIVEEDGDPELIAYTVEGLAYKDGRYYVLYDGTMNEIGTYDCLLPQNIKESVGD